MSRRLAFGAGLVTLAALAAGVAPARAEISDGVVRIGVLNDMSSLYADYTGQGSVVAAHLAAEDFAREALDIKVEIVAADHQNKPDVGTAIARKWRDLDKVDAIVDVPNSGVALAVNEVLRNSRMAFLASSTASSDLTGKACSPNTVQWTFDTWALANSTGKAVIERGGTSWFFITADYAFGHVLEHDAANVVAAQGGTVVGAARHPINTADFSSYLLQAQTSGAKVIAFANAGGDTSTSLKQAAEFGIGRNSGQMLAGLLMFVNDVHAIGLETAQGLLLTEAFYWDLNDATRAWSKRFAERQGGKMPSMNHAGVYSAVLAYLRAVEAARSDDGVTVVNRMKQAPIHDPLFGDVTVRADGRAVHPMYLFQVKSLAESKGPYDYYKLVATIPADQAFRPLAAGGCPLVKKD